MSGRQILTAAIITLALSATGNAQYLFTEVLDDKLLKNERYKDVKTFDVGFTGAWGHPDKEKLERKAKEAARRLLAGVTYKSERPGLEELERTFVEGSHMNVIVLVQLAWNADASRIHTGASVKTLFIVDKKDAEVNTLGSPLPNLNRTEASTVVACHRDRLIAEVERAIQTNLEYLSDGFFESR